MTRTSNGHQDKRNRKPSASTLSSSSVDTESDSSTDSDSSGTDDSDVFEAEPYGIVENGSVINGPNLIDTDANRIS